MINFDGFLITTVINREDKAFKEFTSKVMGFSSSEKKDITNFGNFSDILASELSALKQIENFTLIEKYKSIIIVKNQSKMKPSSIFRWMRERNIKFKNIMRVFPLDLIVKTSNIADNNKVTENINSAVQNNNVVENNNTVESKNFEQNNNGSVQNNNSAVQNYIDDLNLIYNLIDNYHFNNTYKILFEGRLCPDLKNRMFEIIIPKIKIKVDLVNPDDVFVIQAFKYYIGLCILKNDVNNFNFSENFHYNVQN